MQQFLVGRREADVKAHKDIKAVQTYAHELGALQISGSHKDALYDAGLREQVLPNLQVSMQLSVSQVALMNSCLRCPPCSVASHARVNADTLAHTTGQANGCLAASVAPVAVHVHT